MFQPRHGQWCKFRVDDPSKLERLGAWKAGNMFIGIFQKPGDIHVVSESGDTITVIDQAGVHSLILRLDNVRDCEPVKDKKDIPPGRKIAEGWEPRG